MVKNWASIHKREAKNRFYGGVSFCKRVGGTVAWKTRQPQKTFYCFCGTLGGVPKQRMRPVCEFEGCGRRIASRKLCSTHYQQRLAGKTLTPIRVKRSGDDDPELWFWPQVQKSGPDECWMWIGAVGGWGYGFVWSGEKSLMAHRHSYEITHGKIPDGMQIDHICRTRICVNPNHLRIATNKQNGENTSPSGNARNVSGYRGVSWESGRKKWRAVVGHNGKKVVGGRYNTPEEANEEVIRMRAALFTHI